MNDTCGIEEWNVFVPFRAGMKWETPTQPTASLQAGLFCDQAFGPLWDWNAVYVVVELRSMNDMYVTQLNVFSRGCYPLPITSSS